MTGLAEKSKLETRLERWMKELPYCALVLASISLIGMSIFALIRANVEDFSPYVSSLIYFLGWCRWLLTVFGLWYAGSIVGVLFKRGLMGLEIWEYLRGFFGCLYFVAPSRLLSLLSSWLEASL